MKDKQIIDGVDVSACCHKGKDYACTCPHYKKECGRNPNCHYKIVQRQTKELDKFYKSELELKQKLFRKEQECETLASQLDFAAQKKECLEQECEELKKKVQDYKGLITSTGKMNYQLLQEQDKLKNCITEIKKIAENAQSFVGRINIIGDDVFEEMEQILQKISEVEK